MKLNKKNYYSYDANKEYVSFSQLKSFAQCESKCLAELKGEYTRDTSTAMLVGSYVDSYLDGTKAFGEFKIEHPEIFKKDGTLKSDFVMAEDLITRIKGDKVFRSLLRGRRQVIMTGKIVGVPIKIKIDSLHKDKIVDGKVMRDLEDIYDEEYGCRVPWWKYYRYDWQAFIYQRIVAQNTGNVLPFMDAVVTKESGYDLRAFQYSDETIAEAGREVMDLLPRLQKAKNGEIKPCSCGHCDLCRAQRTLARGQFEII